MFENNSREKSESKNKIKQYLKLNCNGKRKSNLMK